MKEHFGVRARASRDVIITKFAMKGYESGEKGLVRVLEDTYINSDMKRSFRLCRMKKTNLLRA